MTTSLLADVAAIGTFLGVLFAGAQLVLNRRQVVLNRHQIVLNRHQAQTQFEDSLTAVYRDLAAELPVEVFFNDPIEPEVVTENRSVFYRYFDLCNEQAFLHEQGRVSDATWDQWRDGIQANFARGAFRTAWLEEIAPHIGNDFQELKRVLETFPAPDNRPRTRR